MASMTSLLADWQDEKASGDVEKENRFRRARRGKSRNRFITVGLVILVLLALGAVHRTRGMVRNGWWERAGTKAPACQVPAAEEMVMGFKDV